MFFCSNLGIFKRLCSQDKKFVPLGIETGNYTELYELYRYYTAYPSFSFSH
jgi:hypothetical protein